jgi:hypothetical protein
MMKFLKPMAVVALAIVFANSAQAAWVSDSFTQTLTAYSRPLGSPPTSGLLPLYQYTGETIDPTFTVSYADTTQLTIDSAVLEIVSRGAKSVDTELYTVSIGLTELGPLTGEYCNWDPVTDTFTGLESLMPTANGPLAVTIAGTLDHGIVIYDSATLTIDYTYKDPVVPAPSAIVLCSLGTGMVGWIRRRILSQ